jgi:hypothetical protein
VSSSGHIATLRTADATTGIYKQMNRSARRCAARLLTATGVLVAAAVATPTAATAAHGSASLSRTAEEPAAGATYSVGPISDVSVGCPGTGDISEAVDASQDYVYQEFEGCDHADGIGFARSTTGGDNYAPPVALPDSSGGWDPWLAVAPDGTLYAAFMNTIDHHTYPVIDVSDNYGSTFTVEHSLRPRREHNWGDADYIAVASNGTLYVAWDYGPSNAEVKSRCSPTGSCWATNGDLNVVVQSSTDDAETFTPMTVVNPGYPDGGDDEADVTIAPDGAIDVLYEGYEVINPRTLKLADGHEYFTTSNDSGQTWSAPVEVGATAGQITINEWWNDGSIATDAAGDLYATWDTQGTTGTQKTDIGWVSFSTDGGQEWSTPVQATPDQKDVPHIIEVTGAGSDGAYVAWLSSSNPRGYALYLRAFSISADGGAGGWLSDAVRISQKFGEVNAFPGDTFGIATFSPTALELSWGSAIARSRGKTSVFAAPVEEQLTGAPTRDGRPRQSTSEPDRGLGVSSPRRNEAPGQRRRRGAPGHAAHVQVSVATGA